MDHKISVIKVACTLTLGKWLSHRCRSIYKFNKRECSKSFPRRIRDRHAIGLRTAGNRWLRFIRPTYNVNYTSKSDKIHDKTYHYLVITSQCRSSMQIQSESIRFALNFDQKHCEYALTRFTRLFYTSSHLN